MARTKPSLLSALSGCSLLAALLLWLAVEILPRWVAPAYYVTAVTSTSTSDDVMNAAFTKATTETGIAASVRPRGKWAGSVFLFVPAATAQAGKERTQALFSVMAADLAYRGKPELNREPPGDPQPLPPFYVRPMVEIVSGLAILLGVLSLGFLSLGYYRAIGAQPPALRTEWSREKDGRASAPKSEEEFDY